MRILLAGVLALGVCVSPAVAQGGMEQHPAKVKVVSTSLTIKADGKTDVFTLADLQALPQRTLVVHNGHSNVDETYTGVGVSDLLLKYGFNMENGGPKKIYHSYLRAEGTDKYYVIYSVSELEPMLHTGDSIVALTVDGKPLTQDGRFKMVVAGEQRPARWVTNLVSLTVVTVD